MPPRRCTLKIHVIGDPGAGKTTLAQRLANHLNCTHIELDALYWGPNWSEPEESIFRQQVAQALRTDAWVVDGNYCELRTSLWRQADLVVWLDYSLGVVLPRLAWRTGRYALTQEALWDSGNRVRWSQLLGAESIVWRTLRKHYQRRRAYEAVWEHTDYPTTQFVRLFSPYATHYWLRGFLSVSASLPIRPLAT